MNRRIEKSNESEDFWSIQEDSGLREILDISRRQASLCYFCPVKSFLSSSFLIKKKSCTLTQGVKIASCCLWLREKDISQIYWLSRDLMFSFLLSHSHQLNVRACVVLSAKMTARFLSASFNCLCGRSSPTSVEQTVFHIYTVKSCLTK